MDDHNPSVAAANSGLEERFEYTKNENTVTLKARLQMDFRRQERLFWIKWASHEIIPEWTQVLSHDIRRRQYIHKMVSARMEMVQVGLHLSVLNGNYQILRTKIAKYPIASN